jgi:hypothetical protein
MSNTNYIQQVSTLPVVGIAGIEFRFVEVTTGGAGTYTFCAPGCNTCTGIYNPTACIAPCLTGYTFLASNNSCPINCLST